MRRKTIALDFDGVLHQYSKKWQDGSIYDPPIPHTKWALQKLAEEYDLIIFTCRTPIEDVEKWIYEQTGVKIPATNSKPHADMYLDDRGYHFTGCWVTALNEIEKRAANNFGSDDQWKAAV